MGPTAASVAFHLVVCLAVSSLASGNVGNGYRLTSINNTIVGDTIVANLKVIEPTKTYGDDITDLRLVVRYETADRLHVHITDAHDDRWEIPDNVIPRQADHDLLQLNTGETSFSSRHLEFSYTSNPFGFAITRRATGEVLFNTTPPAAGGEAQDVFGSLVFKDQYLELSTQVLKTASLYGLGESTRPDGLRLTHGRTYTLWAADIPSLSVDIDLYGSFPFYLDVRQGGSSHGVLLLNSNGMDITYGNDSLTYRIVGGVLDLYYFAGPSPLSVVSQYAELVGRPAPMPYWSFGFHQCKYGYKNLEELESVVANYRKANLPLEVMWTDIDYMNGWRDFTTDPVNFPEDKLRSFVDQLHADGQKYVVIVDPGIKTDYNYTTFLRGLESDIYIKDYQGDNYLAQVWPGPVYFPDFLNPKTPAYWAREISDFHKVVPFDGLWIDMNEASNFCSGRKCSLPTNQACPDPKQQTVCCLVCDSSNPTLYDEPPYKINYGGEHRDLGIKTIATSARHYNDIVEYNAHNLYGLTESIATEEALKSALGTRPFLLSRSTFVGSGKYTAHWTGDNGATFNDLAYSIVSTLNSGLFGIPMVGADICGFNGGTTEELCNRWIQLGAFYPFSRNHADLKSPNQELYIWESVTRSAHAALGLRYRLLPYIYTLAFEAHITGHPIARPLFFHFPEEPITLDINGQLLLGPSILVSPVLEEGATSVRAYFPSGTWYNLFDSTRISSPQGSYHLLPAPLEVINVHVREGSILPLQDVRLTTALARKTPFTLLLAFSLEKSDLQLAHGRLFIDSEEEVKMRIARWKSTFVKYSALLSHRAGGSLTARVGRSGGYALKEGLTVQTVTVLGLRSAPSRLHINGKTASRHVTVAFDPSTFRVDISGLDLSVGQDFDLKWFA